MGDVCGYRQQPSDRQHMGTAFNPAKTSPASWDAFSEGQKAQARGNAR